MDSASLGEELQRYVVKRPGYREVIIEAIFANSLSQIITVIIIIILLGPQKTTEFVAFLAVVEKIRQKCELASRGG